MRGDLHTVLLLVLPASLLSLPQQQQQQQPVAAEDDPWLAVINGNNNVDKPQQDDSEYYQFEDTQQQQQQQVLPPQQRYPDRRQDLAQPQVPQQLPPQRRYPQGPPPQAPPRGQFRGGQPQPVQRRPLPPPPVKRPQKEEPGLLDTIAQGVSNVFQPATCAATNLIADEKLKDDDFIKAQMDCAMGVKPCDDIGKQIKILAPEVLAGRCPAPCNPCIKNQIRKVMSQLSQKYPREFQTMMQRLGRRGKK